MARIDLPSHPRILVIALRRLGDVLLTTPLVASLRRAWPDATIDALVFADTAGILYGNADINNVVTMPGKRTVSQSLELAARLWRRYDLAVSTQSGDRPTFFTLLAGRQRVALVDQTFGGRIKQGLLDRSLIHVPGVHRVEEMLRLADVLGIDRVPQLVTPRPRDSDAMPPGNYAVIHAAPMFGYKQWTAQGWCDLASALAARGMKVMATGGPSPSERV
jgi:heptosyltransferase-3